MWIPSTSWQGFPVILLRVTICRVLYLLKTPNAGYAIHNSPSYPKTACRRKRSYIMKLSAIDIRTPIKGVLSRKQAPLDDSPLPCSQCSQAPCACHTAHSHPRVLGWIGTTALAMGGSNQSLFLIGALILGQGSAAVPLLIVGLLLSWAAAFGWTELVLMYPNRVGGIAASCAEAFRPYSPVLANLTGVCYWWGWVPTCGLTAILSATAISEWYLPNVPIPLLAIILVVLFTVVNLCGVRWVTRLAVPIAVVSAGLALVSGLAPILAGSVAW